MLSKFIETELNAYISEQRLTESPLMVKLIIKAFEAYDEYKRLVSKPTSNCKCNTRYTYTSTVAPVGLQTYSEVHSKCKHDNCNCFCKTHRSAF